MLPGCHLIGSKNSPGSVLFSFASEEASPDGIYPTNIRESVAFTLVPQPYNYFERNID
ncbi:hypothetical protein SAMN05192553_104143 [Cyclobacterium xiamenense]|uniref:Uncharacterized protein n=1 Tax=Cyclobacterium xiamenense TaxID=1297121 RepID=A0A1H6ZC26_9BACT|nr:hypothetical protein SAMN05192553_104143 [Cyclobacterium xiamenense]